MHPTSRRRSLRVVLSAAAFAAGCGAPTPEVTEVRVAESRAPAGTAATSPIEDPGTAEPPRPRPKPPSSQAQPPPDTGPSSDDVARARELFQEGAAAYANADYQTACGRFQAAYDLVPNRALLFNLGSCELKMGHTARACAHFRKYVADGDPADPRIQQVNAQVANRCP